MAEIGTQSQQMPRQEDDLLRRVKILEQQVQQVTSAAAGAQAVASSLTSLLSNQVYPAVGSSSATATWGGSYATFTSFNFTVPAGYTRAVIVASGGSATFSNASIEDYRMQAVINGSAGGESRSITSQSSFISAFAAANLSGLSTGQNIPIALQGHLTVGPGGTSGIAVLTAMALYLK